MLKENAVALIILDGFGISSKTAEEGNAVAAAVKKNFDGYWNINAHTLLHACGEYVGLPDGQMGNSEVGHQNIGAGRIVPQELMRINIDIKNGVFLRNEQFGKAIEHCKKHKNSCIHIMILASDGGVHSHINHLYELLKLFAKTDIEVYIHCFTDGRDTDPKSGIGFIRDLEEKIKETGCGKIATVQGRSYAMDRDNDFAKLSQGFGVMTDKDRKADFATAEEAVMTSYKTLGSDGKELTDEFIVPCRIEGGKPISDNDALIFCNFRPDRARSIMQMFIFDVSEMETWYGKAKTPLPGGQSDIVKITENRPKNLFIVAMSGYDASINSRMHIAYDKQIIPMTLGEYLSMRKLKQLRIAETEKYNHVTSFFSGNRDEEFDGELRVLIKSPAGITYDKKPEMSAEEVADRCIELINSEDYCFDLIVLNFANPDMVGHTGVFDAAKKAVEFVDICLGRVVEAVLRAGGTAVITADHGNADEMIDEKGKISTQHSLNPVPFIIVENPERKNTEHPIKLRDGGALCDIAPTILELMNLEKPVEFTGESLIVMQ